MAVQSTIEANNRNSGGRGPGCSLTYRAVRKNHELVRQVDLVAVAAKPADRLGPTAPAPPPALPRRTVAAMTKHVPRASIVPSRPCDPIMCMTGRSGSQRGQHAMNNIDAMPTPRRAGNQGDDCNRSDLPRLERRSRNSAVRQPSAIPSMPPRYDFSCQIALVVQVERANGPMTTKASSSVKNSGVPRRHRSSPRQTMGKKR